jgi:exonuclease VII large subunit
MNTKLDQCCDRLKEEIKTAETSLSNISEHLESASKEKIEALEARWKNALAKCETKREDATSAGQKFRQFLAEKKAEVISKYEDWRADREIEKLEKHADKLEDHAVNAVVVAAFALLEAEAAILEALKARKIAVEVAG